MRPRVVIGFLLATCAGQASAQAGRQARYTVAQDGSGQYKTVQEAVDAAPEQGAVLAIKPGTYREKLRIEKRGVELRGAGSRAEDTVLVWGDSAKMAGGTGKSFSVSVTGDDFVATNLTIQNDWEKTHTREGEGSQAVALYLTGDRAVLRNVRLLGYQDTLYAASKTCHGGGPNAGRVPGDTTTQPPCQAARQLFEDCYIEGHVDFIFGDAKAAFHHCELHALKSTSDMFTAQSRLYPGEDSGYLFRDCTLTGEEGATHVILGRPWRAYSTVYFINTRVKGVTLAPEGWDEWDGRLATATYAEYNTGPGADVSKRTPMSKQLNPAEAAKLTVKSWLAGTDRWDPGATR